MLKNALLNYAYLPCVLQSLCEIAKKPALALNTCLYVLIQTFKVVKDCGFSQELFQLLFASQISRERLAQIRERPKDP